MYETHSSSHAAETVTGPIVFVHGSLSSRHMWASYPAALGSRSASPAAALLVSGALVRAAPRASPSAYPAPATCCR